MGSLPWEPDRPLTAEIARSAIQAVFPSVDVSQLDVVGSGWEFDVYVTADGWAFRFPRRSEYQGLFEQERPALALAWAALPPTINVPLVELLGTPSPEFPYTFAGHRFIEGVAADRVSPDLRPELAQSLGTALGAIHSVPVSSASAAGIRVEAPPNEGAREWLRRNLAGASRLTGSDRTLSRAVGWVAALDDPLRALESPHCFIHHDLAPEHLVVDPTTGGLVGILDWTDAISGDPARDFVTCVTFGGWSFVEEVLSCYSHRADEGLAERIQFMARFLSVMWLGEAYLNGGDVCKHIRWVHSAFADGSTS